MKTPGIINTVAALREQVGSWRRSGGRVALVPTMGALHAGHLCLAALARNNADHVVVSIFVNPAQFAPHEDFGRYPRDVAGDCAKLAEGGATDAVFLPSVDAVYPDGFATRIEVVGPALGLESDFRPHFFSGVATIVAKLLIAAAPDVAVFGEKDYQQLLVVRRLVRDLHLPVEILGAAIARETDGLAMSSRNAYLSPEGRQIAGQLNRVLAETAARAGVGEPISAVERGGSEAILRAGFDSVDYVTVRDAATLAKLETAVSDMRVLAAATIGATRLIDNMPARI